MVNENLEKKTNEKGDEVVDRVQHPVLTSKELNDYVKLARGNDNQKVNDSGQNTDYRS